MGFHIHAKWTHRMKPYPSKRLAPKTEPRWLTSDEVQKKYHTCDDGEPEFELLEDLWFQDSRGYDMVVSKGFRYDGASIPAFLPIFFESYRCEASFALHDHLYRTPPPGMKRKDADRILREAMKASGGERWKIFLFWRALKRGGWWAWKKHRGNDA